MVAEAEVFPDWKEADWRKAAEAALKGASLDKLVTRTADGLRIEPVYQPGDGPRALRAEGPWRVIARLDHPDAREANAQALEDLLAAPTVCRSFSPARSAPMASASNDPTRRRWLRLSTAFSSTPEPASNPTSAPNGPVEALAFAGPYPEQRRRAGDQRRVVRPRSLRRGGAWTLSLRLGGSRQAPMSRPALELKAGRFDGPFFLADARSVHAAGVSASQELAFALGAGVSLLRALGDAGVAPDKARAMVAFRLASDAEEFVELRSSARCASSGRGSRRSAGSPPRAAYVQAESAWRMMTWRRPLRERDARIDRGLFGRPRRRRSASVLPHPLAVGLPGGLARRLARNGQLVLLRESHLGFVEDPAAGAGGFEALTRSVSEKGWALFQEIEAEGGLPVALAKGDFQRKAAENLTALRRDIAKLKTPITGVSAHPKLDEPPVDLASGAPDPAPYVATAGALAPIRLAEPFEALRGRSDAALETRGERPKAYLVAIGPEPVHKRRVAYMRDWLEAGGVQPVYDGEAADPEEAVARLKASALRSPACAATTKPTPRAPRPLLPRSRPRA